MLGKSFQNLTTGIVIIVNTHSILFEKDTRITMKEIKAKTDILKLIAQRILIKTLEKRKSSMLLDTA